MKHEFGKDDYLTAKSYEAESLMYIGKIYDATDKFEAVKNEISKELVFDRPLIYVNVCNQLGNCYMKCDYLDQALDNYQTSLYLISKLEDKEQIDELIKAKICQNIA